MLEGLTGAMEVVAVVAVAPTEAEAAPEVAAVAPVVTVAAPAVEVAAVTGAEVGVLLAAVEEAAGAALVCCTTTPVIPGRLGTGTPAALEY